MEAASGPDSPTEPQLEPQLEPSIVTSIDDPRLQPFRALKGMGVRPDGTFVAESELVLDRLLESKYPVRSILITPARAARLEAQIAMANAQRDIRFEVLVAEREIIDAVVGYPLHRGVITLAERRSLPPVVDVLAKARTVIVMEDIADPDNIGAIFRHAAGFGVDAVILTGHTADPLYRRTIRVAMGWTLAIPYCRTAPEDGPITDLLDAAGFTSFALTPEASAPTLAEALATLREASKVALLVGAEGPGLKPETMNEVTSKARIPMAVGVDSFNVATSSAIALFALTSAQPSRLNRTVI
jgi:tRNA G18 (ribose-2'-O)-methylase SpoU